MLDNTYVYFLMQIVLEAFQRQVVNNVPRIPVTHIKRNEREESKFRFSRDCHNCAKGTGILQLKKKKNKVDGKWSFRISPVLGVAGYFVYGARTRRTRTC